ncbi:hypothetical protein [Kribbella sp. NBC_00889]|uniref:hypothetical protein n=1 Tax=Kribbella sp. NBC_00889 TaxID=2975974 RepID=UPI003863A2D1|nr:hypothetical protein OG817_44930 [Kribbella sp. NBC_00889]
MTLLTLPHAAASYATSVTVVSHELHSTECLDPVFLGCERPELQLLVDLDTNGGPGASSSCAGPTNGSFQNVVQDQTVCSSKAVTGDFTVRVTLIDVDVCPPGSSGCVTSTAADLTPGPGQSYEVSLAPWHIGTRTYTSPGGASWVSFSVTLDPISAGVSWIEPIGTMGGQPQVTFDPTLGQTVVVRGSMVKPTGLEYSVTRRATAQTPEQRWVLTSGPFWNSAFRLDWDGTIPGDRRPLPDGIYDLGLRDIAHKGPGPAFNETRPVRIQRTPANTARATVTGLYPTASWDFRNGAVDLLGTSTGGTLKLQVAPRPAGGCGSVSWTTLTYESAPVARPGGPIYLSWDGRDSAGQLVAGNSFCLRANLVASNVGTAVSGSIGLAALTPSTGLETWVFPSPIVPYSQGRGSASIKALVVDIAHRDRYASTISIQASPAGAPGSAEAFAPVVVATCTRAKSCSAALPAALASASAIVYRATVSEAGDAPGGAKTASSGWRVTDLNPLPSRTWRVSVPGLVEGGKVRTPPVSQTMDIVYYPGSGNDLAVADQARRFEAQVASNVQFLFGLGSPRGPTSMARHADAMTFIVSPQTVVDVRGSGNEMCRWSGLVAVSYAEANGVLHHANCRDSAWPASHEYSSDDASTDWHELHHSLYNEADEYCCDGGYFDGVNVYGSQSGCSTRTASTTPCSEIFMASTTPGVADRHTGWWRGDPLPDVMVFNDLVENADDLRAAEAAFARCASNRC